jgi:hypothetical protein
VGAERWAAAAASASSGQKLGETYFFLPGGVGRPVPLVLHASNSPQPGATLLLPLNLPGVDETRIPESVDRTVASLPQVPETPVVEPPDAPVAQQVVAPAVALFTQQIAPGQDVVLPVADLAAPGEQDGAPSEEGTQPAMTMLSPPLLVLA